MAINSILPPYPMFFDLAGKPLEGGSVYIGEAGYEARSKPKASFFDMALTVPTGTSTGAAVRTSGGYPTFNGAARMIYVDGDFSITVLDRNGVLLYTSLSRSLAYAIDSSTVTALGLDDRLLYRSATEPSPTAAGALWFDTGTNVLKRRNATNTGWIDVSPETIPAYNLWGNPNGSAGPLAAMTPAQGAAALGFLSTLSTPLNLVLPGGIIIKGGSVALGSPGAGADSSTAVSFAAAFPTACVVVVITTNDKYCPGSYTSLTASGFTAQAHNFFGATVTGLTGRWIAIGY